jgi:glyoxylase-like metal-dependent hydrolase (beta-lactamase superfamily II)
MAAASQFANSIFEDQGVPLVHETAGVAKDSDWTEAGAFPVVPGVWRIPLPLPQDSLRAVNVYAIADGERVVLIDSGWALPKSEQVLAQSLGAIGYGLEDISQFLVTHVHTDHFGQAVALRRRFGTIVRLGIGERPSLEGLLARPGEVAQQQVLVTAGAEHFTSAITELRRSQLTGTTAWALPDSWLQDGQTLELCDRSLQVIHTPGHTSGHVVFHDARSRVLFSGDHVLPRITPSIGFENMVAPSPLSDYLTSLHLLRAAPDALLLPAHGPVSQSVHERVDQLLEHHRRRLEATHRALKDGASTGYLVAMQLRWTRRQLRLDELTPVNALLAVTETLAHLTVLAERGQLRRTVADDGVAHFRA